MTREVLVISASGGRTSMYMLDWILENKRDEYEVIGVFANTGWEHPKTLEFVHNCEKKWKDLYNFYLVWVEAEVQDGRVSTQHKIVDFLNASRNLEPFRAVCSKYGIPNVSYPIVQGS